MSGTSEEERRPPAWLCGLAPLAGPVAFAVAQASGEGTPVLLALAVAAVVTAGGLLLPRWTSAGRLVSTAGSLGLLVLLGRGESPSPSLSLAVLLLVTGFLDSIWFAPARARRRVGHPDVSLGAAAALRASAWIGASFALTVALSRLASDPLIVLAAGAGLLLFTVRLVRVLAGSRVRRYLSPRKRFVLQAGLMGSLPLVLMMWNRWPWALALGALSPLLVLALLGAGEEGHIERGSLWESILKRPARLLIITFAGLSVVGAVLLASPAASAGRVHPFDAAFTAVSAVCVTGLVVVDTARDFTPLGQAFILLLIQLGGLGIMAYAAAIFGVLGKRLGLRYEGAAASLMSAEDRGRLGDAIRRLFAVTFAAEGAGTLILSLLFRGEGDSWGEAVWRGLFTAISAFCNAGFALQTDNVVPYQQNPWILHTVAALIVAGGLSPLGVVGAVQLARRRRVTTQIKLTLAVSAALLLAGSILIGAAEWSRTLAGLPFLDRLHNAWFQSVTARTAGFNSVDIAALHPATQAIVMALMFIGGSPGGTAGGIKTTTAAVLLLGVLATAGTGRAARVFGRRIPQGIFYKAAAVATAGLLSAFAAVIAILLTQTLDAYQALFEVLSALGTVGLSTGGTALLDGIGKIIIMACMFLGRVGPLTMFLFLSDPHARRDPEAPVETVDVG